MKSYRSSLYLNDSLKSFLNKLINKIINSKDIEEEYKQKLKEKYKDIFSSLVPLNISNIIFIGKNISLNKWIIQKIAHL